MRQARARQKQRAFEIAMPLLELVSSIVITAGFGNRRQYKKPGSSLPNLTKIKLWTHMD